MNESTATRYQRLRRTAQMVGLAVGAAWLAIVVFSPAGRWVADWAWSASPGWAVLLFVTALVVVWEAVALPASVFAAVRGERRFRKGDVAVSSLLIAQFRDTCTGIVIAIAGGLVVYGAIALAGGWWWLVVGGLGAPMVVVATAVAGVTVRAAADGLPVPREALTDRLSALVERASGRRVPVREWTDPASAAPTALVTGVGPSGAILLSRSMVADWSDDEIAVVVAHELSHHVHHDLWRKAALDALVLVAALGAAHVVTVTAGPGLDVQALADLTALPLIGLTAWLAWWGLRPIRLAQSRAHERAADRYALSVTGNPEAFRTAIRRLAAQHLAEERPSTVTRLFFHRHPTVEERLTASLKR